MGATARDCPIGVEVGFFVCCCCCMHEFFPKLGVGVCVFGVWVFSFGHFLALVCVWSELFLFLST